jgi:hypothetical protein
MHEGVNKDALPKNWKTANRKKFKTVTGLFLEYLETCYSTFLYSSPLGDI